MSVLAQVGLWLLGLVGFIVIVSVGAWCLIVRAINSASAVDETTRDG